MLHVTLAYGSEASLFDNDEEQLPCQDSSLPLLFVCGNSADVLVPMQVCRAAAVDDIAEQHQQQQSAVLQAAPAAEALQQQQQQQQQGEALQQLSFSNR
jgi:hypothetical protein